MTCHWEASQRPMIIKTVWIGGHRHAILTQGDCFTKRNKEVRNATNRCSEGEISIPYFSTDVQKISILKHPTPRVTKERRIRLVERVQHVGQVDIVEKNPLSERVLQWLDLAGQDNFKFEVDVEKLAKLNLERDEKLKVEYCNIKFSNEDFGKIGTDKSAERTNGKFSKCWQYWEDKKYIDDDSDCDANEYRDCNVYKAEEYEKFSAKFKEKPELEEHKCLDCHENKMYDRSIARVKRKKLHIFIPSPCKNEG